MRAPKVNEKPDQEKKWIKEGTPAFCEIEKVIEKKKTLNDLKLCTEFRHSGKYKLQHSRITNNWVVLRKLKSVGTRHAFRRCLKN